MGQSQGAFIIPLEQIEREGLIKPLSFFTKVLRPCFVSVDIDGFTSNEAPGASQVWTTGIRTNEFIALLSMLNQNLSLQALGTYRSFSTF